MGANGRTISENMLRGKALSTNLLTVASRNRGKHWDKYKAERQRLLRNGRSVISEAVKKLKESDGFKCAIEAAKKAIEHRCKDTVLRDRSKDGSPGNAVTSESNRYCDRTYGNRSSINYRAEDNKDDGVPPCTSRMLTDHCVV